MSVTLKQLMERKERKEKMAQRLNEVLEPKSPDEKRFLKKHTSNIAVDNHPHAEPGQFRSTKAKAQRLADPDIGEDEEMYEESDSDKDDAETDLDIDGSDDDDDSDGDNKKKKKKKKKDDDDDSEDEEDDDSEDEDKSVKEETNLSEDVISDLHSIVKNKQSAKVKLGDGKRITVDTLTASAVTKVYNALNGQNKQKFSAALEKNTGSFMKMVDFAMSKVG